MSAAQEIKPEELGARVGALPGIERLRDAVAGAGAHIVGGAVRDLLLGRERVDVDVVVEGDAIALARRIDPEATVHERFGTASVSLDGLTVDLASARSESYARPGALPDVRPGTLAEDLARRDFTINAMAVELSGEGGLLDPHDGAGDLAARVLRVLHDGSFADDPTRALRAARYAARLGLALDPGTEKLLRGADLRTVSAQRVEAELRRIAAEADPARAIGLAAGWGLINVASDDVALLARALGHLTEAPWPALTSPADVVVAVVGAEVGAARELADTAPAGPADAVDAAHGHSGTTLLLARALGADWVQSYVADWRHVRLDIGGDDLLAAGVEQGPAVGRGLEAALRARLDGRASDRDLQLRVALEAAR